MSDFFVNRFIFYHCSFVCSSCVAPFHCNQTQRRNIEENPDPKPSSYDSSPICRWNLNRISTHIFINLSSSRLHLYLQICIYLSETYLYSSVSSVMTTIWSYLGTIWYAQIIQLILKETVFAFVIIILYRESTWHPIFKWMYKFWNKNWWKSV